MLLSFQLKCISGMITLMIIIISAQAEVQRLVVAINIITIIIIAVTIATIIVVVIVATIPIVEWLVCV